MSTETLPPISMPLVEAQEIFSDYIGKDSTNPKQLAANMAALGLVRHRLEILKESPPHLKEDALKLYNFSRALLSIIENMK